MKPGHFLLYSRSDNKFAVDDFLQVLLQDLCL